MVEILLKIGKQPENVGEEEVFGRFCIRDVAENPSGGLLRRPDIRRKSGFAPCSSSAYINPKSNDIYGLLYLLNGGKARPRPPSVRQILKTQELLQLMQTLLAL